MNVPPQQFWHWFTANSRRVFRFEDEREQIFDEISERLSEVNKGLCFEIGPVEDGIREFIISAEGDRRIFPIVRELVAAAPRFSEWRIIPFRPPKDIERFSRVVYEGMPVSVNDIWFTYEPDGPLLHLDLYVRGYGAESNDRLDAAAFLMLDVALGEYVVETRIGAVDRHPLPENPSAEGLLPFKEIVTLVRLPTH